MVYYIDSMAHIVRFAILITSASLYSSGFVLQQWQRYNYNVLTSIETNQKDLMNTNKMRIQKPLIRNFKQLFGEKGGSPEDDPLSKLMQILSASFKSHALHAFVQLNIANIMGDRAMSINDIAHELDICMNHQHSNRKINEDALLRTMRLLTTIDVVHETFHPKYCVDEQSFGVDGSFASTLEADYVMFELSSFGRQLQGGEESDNKLSSCILHWMEKPLHDSWYQLPDHIMGNPIDPFEQANKVSSDFFYNKKDNPQSLIYANDFVKLISDSEINSIINYYDWSMLEGKTVVDIGGYNGKVMGAIASHFPRVNLTLKCLDLPQVIESFDKSKIPKGVELIQGDIMKPSTIPKCDVIFMKHFLDRCMWTEQETVDILKTCAEAVSSGLGMVILGEAVIPSAIDESLVHESYEEELSLSLDSLYMLVGRERQRTKLEWKWLAEKANLTLNDVIFTSSPSCSLIILGSNRSNE